MATRTRTQYRGFRLPKHIDAALLSKARQTGLSNTEIIVTILSRAIDQGELPRVETAKDKRQREFFA